MPQDTTQPQPTSKSLFPTDQDGLLKLETKEKLPYIFLFLLLAASLALPLVNLGMPELGSVHEARVVVTARNMAETDEIIVPYFNGELRLQKMPLPYWAVYGMQKLVGPLDESTFRLPSAILGILGTLLTFWMGRVLFRSWPAATIAALLQALTVKYLIESRLARVDIYLTFWVAVCFLLLCLIFYGRRRRDWLWPLFWATVGIGLLAKHAVFMFVMPALVYGLIAVPDRRGKWQWQVLGIFLFLLIGPSWIVMLIHKLGWDTMKQAWGIEVSENITSVYHRSNHGYLYYLPQLFVLTFPWSALLPIALSAPIWPEFKPERKRLWWLTITSLAAVIAFSFVSKKKVDYLVPALPMFALLGGRSWELLQAMLSRGAKDARTKSFGIWGSAQAILFILTGIVCLTYTFLDPLQNYLLTIVCSLCLGAAGLAALRFMMVQKGYQALIAMMVGTCIFGHILFAFLLPTYNARLSAKAFGQELAQHVGDAPLIYFRGRDATLVYHAHTNIGRINRVFDLAQFVDEHPNAYVLVQGEKCLNMVKPILPRVILHHPRFRDTSIPLPGKDDTAFNLYLLGPGSPDEPTKEFATFDSRRPEWLTSDNLWLAFGFLAQGLFFGRMMLQWFASEKEKKSVVPVGFWWLSLFGGFGLFIYGYHRNDPVIMLGQSTGLIVYVRNLYFVYVKKDDAAGVVVNKPQALPDPSSLPTEGSHGTRESEPPSTAAQTDEPGDPSDSEEKT